MLQLALIHQRDGFKAALRGAMYLVATATGRVGGGSGIIQAQKGAVPVRVVLMAEQGTRRQAIVTRQRGAWTEDAGDLFHGMDSD
jgi:hypothetical protein